MASEIESWLVCDGMGEYVRHFTTAGLNITFTRERSEAMKTTDSQDAYEIARIAREVYNRKYMRMRLA